MSDDEYTADEVGEILDRIYEIDDGAENLAESVETFVKEIVETGTFNPDCQFIVNVSLTLKERITGKHEYNVGNIFIIGMMLGAALERDIPTDTELEDAWRDGEFVLPSRTDDGFLSPEEVTERLPTGEEFSEDLREAIRSEVSE